MMRHTATNDTATRIKTLLQLVVCLGIIIAGFMVVYVWLKSSVQPASVPSHQISAQLSAQPAPTTRDVFTQPFSSDSIWNMPIGNGAQYVDAGLSGNPGNVDWATMPYADEDYLFLDPKAPMTDIKYSDAAWTGKSRCQPTTNQVISTVPMPANYTIASNGENAASTFLMPDGRTIRQMQPVARCTPGQPGTALVKFSEVDLYSKGITGAHGGSNLSSLGGTLRLNELRPGKPAPRHVLKFNIYGEQHFYRCTVAADCFRWPASTADNTALNRYGKKGNAPKAMRMGALLAISPNVDIQKFGFQTEPARQLAWTLQNYGAYVVDDTGSPGFGIMTEAGPQGSFINQFKQDYGYSFKNEVSVQNEWVRDMQRLVELLEVVDNNSASSVGGGGTPRQPLAPKLNAPT